MSRLILHISTSLDGFVAHEDGNIDWLSPEDDQGAARHQANLEMLAQAGMIAMGRAACVQMAPAWSGSESPMASRINALPKVIFSSSLDHVDWENTRITAAPLAEEVPRMKAEADGDIIVFGGGAFGRSLIRERLADELRLTVHPVALGRGIPLMHGLPEPQRFALVGATVFTDGSIAQVLRPA